MNTPEHLTPEVQNFLDKRSAQPELLNLPMRENFPQQLLEIAEQVAEISGTWNPVEIYTADPDDIKRERENLFDAFKNGREYNPKLTYPYAESLELESERPRLLALRKQVLEFEPQGRIDRLARVVMRTKINDDLATIDLVEGIKSKDQEKIARALGQKYPGTDHVLMQYAQERYEVMTREGEPREQKIEGLLTAKEKKWLEEQEFDAPKIKEAFEWTLRDNGILRTEENQKGYQVIIDRSATGIDVRDKSSQGPTVFIPESRKMNGKTLLGLMAHEIEGHGRQAMNGHELFLIGGGSLKMDNEQLYEGYGMRLEGKMKEELFGEVDPAPRIYYAFGVAMAEQGKTFYEIFSDQVKRRIHIGQTIPAGHSLPNFQSLEQKPQDKILTEAWATTYRVMRGYTDMRNTAGYAMAKDLAYLRGWLVDHQLLENNFGHMNEAAVVVQGGLQMLAELDLQPEALPYPYKNSTKKYWEEVLKPQMAA